MREYKYDRFTAYAVGNNGGLSHRRGMERASAELHYGEIETAFTIKGYLLAGVPAVRVSIWDHRYDRTGCEVVLYDGPMDLFSLPQQVEQLRRVGCEVLRPAVPNA